MKFRNLFIAAVVVFVFASNAFAQTNVITVTNFVTINVTNYLTVTNYALTPTVPAKIVALVKVSTNPPASTKVVTPSKYPWNSVFTAGLTLTRGNSDSLLATAKIVSNKKTPINEFSLDADVAYGSANGVANSETYHAFGQWNHLFSEKWYAYLRGEGLHDGIAEVKYRATITSGIGYYVIKNTNTTFALEAGPGLVLERVGVVDTTYATMRVAERFEHKFNKGTARVWENVEFLPQVDKWSDYLINSEVGVESALYKTLSLQVFLDDNFNSEPAVGLKRNDLKLVSGIAYKF